jgi:hypothetical protein
MKKLLCKIFDHTWDDGVESSFLGVGEYLGNGKCCVGAINKCTKFTCKRCGKEKSIKGWIL